MPPAIVGAGIAAAGTIGGSLIASGSQKSAAKSAANAEIQAANQQNALAQQFRAENTANLSPWLQSGSQANSLINAFLFGPQAAQQAPAQASSGPNWGNYLNEYPDVQNDYNLNVSHSLFPTAQSYAQWHFQNYGQNEGRNNGGTVNTAAPQAGANPLDAYQAFTNSPYYQFPLNEGMRQLNTGLASHGGLHSGDAMKSAIQYGQNYGSQQMMNFLGLAGQQSDRGLQAGSAIAGVGQNALASQSQALQSIGQANANRAIAGGIANSNLASGIGNALGNFAGTIFNPGLGSSYGSIRAPGNAAVPLNMSTGVLPYLPGGF